jgi:histidinol phosphatase-like enzyme (inositol monophosphatase family)
MNYTKELQCAIEAAQQAGNLQQEMSTRIQSIVRKSDRSPVTEVDKQCELLIQKHLLSEFPADSFLGEETGNSAGSLTRKWIVDPIDGTRPYIRNIPTYSVLIALEEHSEPVVGVIHLPAMGITCWASKGSGAYLNNKPIRVSDTATLSECTGSALGFLEMSGTAEGQRLFSLMKSWDYNYGFMDAYSYVCVASGRLDLAVNLLDKAWDCASAACIITEAGGVFSDIHGNKSVHNGSIVFGNPSIHKEAIKFFNQ